MKKFLILLPILLSVGCTNSTVEAQDEFNLTTTATKSESTFVKFGVGSDYKEVRASIGNPNTLNIETEKDYEMWEYHELISNEVSFVLFENGRVISWNNMPTYILKE